MEASTTRRADAVRNREAVLEAAIRLLAERPHASMREVADASGLGRTTVYRHFATREDLVAALMDRVITEADARMAAAAAYGADASVVLRRIADDLIELGERYRFLEHHRVAQEERIANRVDGEPNAHERFFTEAQRSGALRSDLSVAWMLTMVRGTSIAGIDELLAGRMSREDVTRMLGDTLVGAFVAR